MDSVQQTLRKSKEVDQKFKAFMAKKQERDKSMQQTMDKIKKTQEIIASTKSTISSIDNLYDSLEKRFSQAIQSALSGVQKNMLLNVADPNWKPNKINQKIFVEHLKKSKQIMFLTGAGISAASGIPTFRGAKGFWDKQNLKNQMVQNVKTPEEILTLSYFNQNQFATWKWLVDFYNIKSKAQLNKGHLALHSVMTEIINANKSTMLVTQNIDDFHIQALKKEKQKRKQIKQYKICEIHGNIRKLRCNSCSQAKKQIQFYDFKDYIKPIEAKEKPKCSKCGNRLRPHIMFFDQFYTQLYNEVQTVKNFTKQSDLLVVIGTALQTGLAREIVDNALLRKITIIEINLECEIKRPNTMWIEGKSDQILEKAKFELWKMGL